MSYLWSFTPDLPREVKREPYNPYRPKEKKKPNNWVAPEHAKGASAMNRDYPRDDFGQRIEGRERELKIDKRPSIMIPPRKTRMGWK
jgi:hypothetical protein